MDEFEPALHPPGQRGSGLEIVAAKGGRGTSCGPDGGPIGGVLVDCRGLESALEAVRVSVEAVRVSVEAVRVSIEALRCFRGRERLEEVPEKVN